MVLVNFAGGLIFIKKRAEAKWVLGAIMPAGLLMEVMYSQFGYQRILGLPHVIFWTPLLVYLWTRRGAWDVSSLPGKWLAVVFATNLTSLIIDYIDVARYLSGERL